MFLPCIASFSPSRLDFHLVSAETGAQRQVLLQNHAEHECLLNHLAPRGPPDTLSIEAPVLPIKIAPGEGLKLELTLTPANAGYYQNRIDAHFAGGPRLSLPVTATVAAAELAFWPEELRVESSLECRQNHVVHLYNLGGAEKTFRLELTGEGAAAFGFDAGEEQLIRLEPGAAHDVPIYFETLEEGEHRAELRAGDAVFALAGRAFRAARAEETHRTWARPKVDVLFVFDNSEAMIGGRIHLENQVEDWRDRASHVARNFFFAFTTTDLGRNGEGGRLLPLAGARFLTPETPWSEWIHLIPSTSGSTHTHGLEAIQRALAEPLQSGHNAGFPRPESELFVAVISASDDRSPGPVDSYLGDYHLQTFVGEAGGCSGHGFTAEDGARYREAASGSAGHQSLCRERWELASNVPGTWPAPTRNHFFLTETPRPSTIDVTVDGVSWPRWQYDSSTNRVTFDLGADVPEDKEVLISYEPRCGLAP